MRNISIIIVNYNGRLFLHECLVSIKNSESSDEEIILVDNASADGSCEYVRKEFPSVKVLELDKNYGFARANNIGAESAKGKYLAFLNNDTVVTPRWLKNLSAVMESDPTIGVAGSKLLLPSGKVNSAGANIVFTGGGYDIGFMDSDSEKYNLPGLRGAVCAASLLVGRESFLALGGFDPLYFMYFEDVDLCWRHWLAGYKVVYVPDSIVYHRFGGTSGSSKHTPLRVFCGTRNSMFNILKNNELHNLLLALGFNVLYHGLKLLILLVTLQWAAGWALLKAYCSLLYYFPAMLRKRKDIQKKRKINDSYLFRNSMIVSISGTVKEYLRLLKI